MNCSDAVELLFSGEAVGDSELIGHLSMCPSCAQLAAGQEWLESGFEDLRLARPVPPPFEEISPYAAAAARSRRLRALLRRASPFAFAVGAAVAATVVVVHAIPAASPAIASGDVLSAEAGSRAARLPDGAEMKLASGRATLMTSGGDDILELSSGAVSLRVPKLARGKSLMVKTADALVRVHGTQFTVSLVPDGTQVDVTEGLVEVQPSGTGRTPVFLHPGESTLVEPLLTYRARARATAVAALDQGDVAAADRALGRLLATRLEGEALSETHALLAWVRREQGSQAAALDLYRESLAEIPAGSRPAWAEDACAERALLEQESGHGVSSWRDCLRRFPKGAHAGLARQRLGVLQ